MAGVKPRTPTANLSDNVNIMKVSDLNVFLIAQVIHKVYTADVINVFQCMFTTNRNIHSHETRQSDHLNIPLYHKNVGKTSIRYRGAVIWNNVFKSGITLSCSQITFKQQLQTQISAGNIKDQLHQPSWYNIKRSCAVLPIHEVVLQYEIWLQFSIHWSWLSTVYLMLHPLCTLLLFSISISKACVSDKEPMNHFGFQLHLLL